MLEYSNIFEHYPLSQYLHQKQLGQIYSSSRSYLSCQYKSLYKQYCHSVIDRKAEIKEQEGVPVKYWKT